MREVSSMGRSPSQEGESRRVPEGEVLSTQLTGQKSQTSNERKVLPGFLDSVYRLVSYPLVECLWQGSGYANEASKLVNTLSCKVEDLVEPFFSWPPSAQGQYVPPPPPSWTNLYSIFGEAVTQAACDIETCGPVCTDLVQTCNTACEIAIKSAVNSAVESQCNVSKQVAAEALAFDASTDLLGYVTQGVEGFKQRALNGLDSAGLAAVLGVGVLSLDHLFQRMFPIIGDKNLSRSNTYFGRAAAWGVRNIRIIGAHVTVGLVVAPYIGSERSVAILQRAVLAHGMAILLKPMIPLTKFIIHLPFKKGAVKAVKTS